MREHLTFALNLTFQLEGSGMALEKELSRWNTHFSFRLFHDNLKEVFSSFIHLQEMLLRKVFEMSFYNFYGNSLYWL
jgi:hypothetical protein